MFTLMRMRCGKWWIVPGLWCLMASFVAGEQPMQKQVIELRTVTLRDAAAEKAFDKYAAEVLIPALNRQGITPVGALAFAPVQPPQGTAAAPTPPAPTDGVPPKVLLVLPSTDATALLSINDRLDADAEYRKSAAEYLKTPAEQPLLERVRSELLMSFEAWPKVVVPKQTAAGRKRLFELRTYESPTEELGRLKVEMFNSGEVSIFRTCEIQPVFMGRALIGDKQPNLTYMTVHDDNDARVAAWKRFAENEDWKKLREVEKYKGTVSKIHKTDWLPKPYSQL